MAKGIDLSSDRFTYTTIGQSVNQHISWGNALRRRKIVLRSPISIPLRFTTGAAGRSASLRDNLTPITSKTAVSVRQRGLTDGSQRKLSRPITERTLPANSAAVSPDLCYELVHSTRVNLLAAAARRPR